MNDQAPAPLGHLARLVERVAPTEPTLRRRQPALFEGSHAALAEPTPDVVHTSASRSDAAPVVAEPAMNPSPTYPPALAETPKRSLHRPPQDHAPSATAPLTVVHHEAPRADATVRIVMAEAPARTAPVSSTAVAPAAAARTPASPPEQPTVPGATRSHPAPSLEDGAMPRPRHAAEPPAEAPLAHSRAPARARQVAAPAQPKPSTPLPAQPATPLRPVLPPALSPRNAARRQAATAPQPAPRAAAPELPPIKVTIGRIEVRAVTGAPSAPRSTTSAAPRLSLDQYLRNRGGQR